MRSEIADPCTASARANASPMPPLESVTSV
jgi:hypothetical protein